MKRRIFSIAGKLCGRVFSLPQLPRAQLELQLYHDGRKKSAEICAGKEAGNAIMWNSAEMRKNAGGENAAYVSKAEKKMRSIPDKNGRNTRKSCGKMRRKCGGNAGEVWGNAIKAKKMR